MIVDTRPAVQAILTADALIDHYVRAVETVRRSAPDDVEMSAQIADANRTYPAIWEQLDEARRVMAAEERNVSAFDRLREAANGNTVLGVDSDRSEVREGYALFGGYYQEQSLTLHFNLRGVELAHRASAALKQALPDADWDGLRLQATMPAPDLKAGSRRLGIVLLIVAIAALIVIRMFLKHL